MVLLLEEEEVDFSLKGGDWASGEFDEVADSTGELWLVESAGLEGEETSGTLFLGSFSDFLEELWEISSGGEGEVRVIVSGSAGDVGEGDEASEGDEDEGEGDGN